MVVDAVDITRETAESLGFAAFAHSAYGTMRCAGFDSFWEYEQSGRKANSDFYRKRLGLVRLCPGHSLLQYHAQGTRRLNDSLSARAVS